MKIPYIESLKEADDLLEKNPDLHAYHVEYLEALEKFAREGLKEFGEIIDDPDIMSKSLLVLDEAILQTMERIVHSIEALAALRQMRAVEKNPRRPEDPRNN